MFDYDVIIIGAGTAGLSAFSEVRKVTEKILVVNRGAYGTTCARVGCMPSKTLIQIGEDYFHRHYFAEQGILGAEHLQLDRKQALRHVRQLRDYFVSFVLQHVEKNKNFFKDGEATFVDQHTIDVSGKKYTAKRFIIATGSSPIIPKPWQALEDKIITTDNLFEQQDLPDQMAVIGGGVIGLEAGQALARLGINVQLFSGHEYIGGLSDPVVNQKAIGIMQEEMKLILNEQAQLSSVATGVKVQAKQVELDVPAVLVAVGRKANVSSLQLANAGVELNDAGLPVFDPTTMQIQNSPIFIAGDVNADRPLLHEAADEGRIAGFNAVRDQVQCFVRRQPVAIVFCQPNIARIGLGYEELNHDLVVIGEVSFDNQGRSRIQGKNKGHLRIYANKECGQLLGAEMIAPGGEHMAHLLAWAMQRKMTAAEAMQMPYYHPVIEEGMRSAMRDLVNKISSKPGGLELPMCNSRAPHGLF